MALDIRQQYAKNKTAKTGEKCICPSCGTEFVKSCYQQAFCKSQSGTTCKDRYWNFVSPLTRNNSNSNLQTIIQIDSGTLLD